MHRTKTTNQQSTIKSVDPPKTSTAKSNFSVHRHFKAAHLNADLFTILVLI